MNACTRKVRMKSAKQERDRERLGILADGGLRLHGHPRRRPRPVVLGLAGDTGTAFVTRGMIGNGRQAASRGVTLRP